MDEFISNLLFIIILLICQINRLKEEHQTIERKRKRSIQCSLLLITTEVATQGARLVEQTTSSRREMQDREILSNKICNSKCLNIMMHRILIRSHSNQACLWGINQEASHLDMLIILEGSNHLRCTLSLKSSNSLHRYPQNSFLTEIRDHIQLSLSTASQQMRKELEVSTPMLWEVTRRTLGDTTQLMQLLQATLRCT